MRGWAHGLCEHEGLGILEEELALIRDFYHGEWFPCLLEISVPDEFTADGRPFRPAMGFPLSIHGQLVMAPSADFLGVGSSEDGYEVRKPHVKSTDSPYLFKAGEDRTGHFYAVEGIPGC
jgi:hypothetical protein